MIKKYTRKIVNNDEIIITNADNKKTFNSYLKSLEKYKPLTKQEEQELFKQLEKTKDEKIIDKISKHNLLYVVKVAKKYQDVLSLSNLTLEDLVAEGNLGLLDAIERYDYTRDYKFISYATWHIQYKIIECIQNNVKTIRLPINIQEQIKKIKKVESELEQKYNREIDVTELYDIIKDSDIKLNGNFNLNELINMRNLSFFESSLNDVIDNKEGSISRQDLLVSDINDLTILNNINNKELNNFFNVVLSKYPDKIRNIFELYFGLNGVKPMVLAKIGNYYETSGERISLIIEKYSKKIKLEYQQYFENKKIPVLRKTNTKRETYGKPLVNQFSNKLIKDEYIMKSTKIPIKFQKMAKDKDVIFLI